MKNDDSKIKKITPAEILQDETTNNEIKIGHKECKWTDPEAMALKIEEYFKRCPYKRTVVGSRGTYQVPVVTMSGLAFYLGFASRMSLYEYEKRPEFSYVIKRARLFIQQEYEKILASGGNPQGAIFVLSNMMRGQEAADVLELRADATPAQKIYVLPSELQEVDTHINEFIKEDDAK